MTQKTLIVLLALLIICGAAGSYIYFLTKETGQEPKLEETSINPMDHLVFEVKKENYSEFQTDKAFGKFNSSKNTIEQATADGVELSSSNLYYDWLNITGAMHMIGDYEREIEILKWFAEAYQGNSISPSNLGVIYKSFVVNNDLSEKYFLMALEREKNHYDIYYNLHELYRYNFEDSKKAVDILEQGRENNPDERKFVTTLIDYHLLLEGKDKASQVLDEWLVEHPEDFSLEAKIEGN